MICLQLYISSFVRTLFSPFAPETDSTSDGNEDKDFVFNSVATYFLTAGLERNNSLVYVRFCCHSFANAVDKMNTNRLS